MCTTFSGILPANKVAHPGFGGNMELTGQRVNRSTSLDYWGFEFSRFRIFEFSRIREISGFEGFRDSRRRGDGDFLGENFLVGGKIVTL